MTFKNLEATEGSIDQLDQSSFVEDVLVGLGSATKSLSCKYFYDQRGSELFDSICHLDEYYLTRTELAIMRQHAAEMGEQIGPGVMLIEYGSGSSTKTRMLLDALPDPVAYVPVDISKEHLFTTAATLQPEIPHIEVLPVCADFTQSFELPFSSRPSTHAAVYFPGSTIGNFERAEAVSLLRVIAEVCGNGGGLLIGIDLQKDPRIIQAAYNDREGVTDAFNLNLLHRINRELGAEMDVANFRHDAFYDEAAGRVDIAIVSRCDQSVRVADHEFEFAEGERIHTEYSHKYTVAGFAEMAAEAGLTLRRAWKDGQEYFAVLHFALLNGEGAG